VPDIEEDEEEEAPVVKKVVKKKIETWFDVNVHKEEHGWLKLDVTEYKPTGIARQAGYGKSKTVKKKTDKFDENWIKIRQWTLDAGDGFNPRKQPSITEWVVE
jgi:hypothetical protein